MSLPARIAMRPATARLPLAAVAKRTMRSSAIARGEAGHGHAAASEEYVEEGFGAPIWRNTILLLVAGFGVYRFSNLHSEPHSSRASSSGRSAPGNESEDSHEAPFITRYLAQFITPPSVYKERNERHLDLVRQAAEDKLFFQDAERPPVHRLRYTAMLDQASPHRLPVGQYSQAKAKPAEEPEAAEASEEPEQKGEDKEE